MLLKTIKNASKLPNEVHINLTQSKTTVRHINQLNFATN